MGTWAEVQVGDLERTRLQETGELVVHKAVTLGDLLEACDDLGIEWETLRLEPFGALGEIAVKVRIEE